MTPDLLPLRIALVGDYNPDVIAHKAIPLAIDDAAAVLELPLRYDWLATSEISLRRRSGRLRCYLGRSRQSL